MKKKQASWVIPTPEQKPENKPEPIEEVKPTESEAQNG
jgi:hypothetical protein